MRDGEEDGGLLGPGYRALTVGLAGSVTVVAFLWLGVTTVLPVIADELGGLSLYGWAFTGFMLANMVAAVTIGQWADRAGAVRPFLASFVVFAAGCVVAAAAPTWIVLLIGRAAQGFGVGGVLTVVYLAVGRGYPERLRARMLALVASCWTVPALAGPVVLGALADLIGWRAVFGVFIPLAVLAVLPTLPRLRGPGSGAPGSPRRLLATIALAIGIGAVLVGLDTRNLVLLVPLVVLGAAIALPALRILLPAGALTLRRGLPSAIAVRGLVSAGYYGSEAFFPLLMTSVFAFSTTVPGSPSRPARCPGSPAPGCRPASTSAAAISAGGAASSSDSCCSPQDPLRSPWPWPCTPTCTRAFRPPSRSPAGRSAAWAWAWSTPRSPPSPSASPPTPKRAPPAAISSSPKPCPSRWSPASAARSSPTARRPAGYRWRRWSRCSP
ncbi:MFS transporter [Amycolatopsis nigrescens]|uniref:MFS transporter n=1 Tax=Amycolatopsis nigrescens TaxID=381445 RepID=UPI0003A3078C|nr:MFS transporter [Amycolatopsis nigrescens]